MNGVRVFNNIFYLDHRAPMVTIAPNNEILLVNNLYFNPQDHYVYQFNGTSYDSLADWRNGTNQERLNSTDFGFESIDPALAAAGEGGTIGTQGQANRLRAYTPRADSVVIDAGLDPLSTFNLDPGPWDYRLANNRVGGAHDLGAVEHPASVAPMPPCGQRKTVLNFESKSLSGWTQSQNDSHNFTFIARATPSRRTGPKRALQGRRYAYLETSRGAAFAAGDSAILVSPQLSGTVQRLSFSYHMLGRDIGSLSIDVKQGSAPWQSNVWRRSGAQGRGWRRATIDLSSFTGDIQVRVRAQAVGGWQGDIAIDNIIVN